jgi:hypothetical protein
MGMRNISWRMTTSYYPSWKLRTHNPLLETLDVFSMSAAAEESVAPTNSSQVFPPTASSPRTAPDTHPTLRSSPGL